MEAPKPGELGQQVAAAFADQGLDVYLSPDYGGVNPDLVAIRPDGGTIVVDVKAGSGAALIRAQEQLWRYRQVLGAADAIVVVPDSQAAVAGGGTIPISQLSEYLQAFATEEVQAPQSPGTVPEKADPGQGPAEVAVARPLHRTIFAAMPFDPAFDDVFWYGMRPAAESIDGTCKRIDHEEFAGDVVSEITETIRRSAAVIADLSGARPNVMYEAGYAAAIGAPVIQISSDPLDTLPFDVRQNRTIHYAKGQTRPLQQALTRALETLAR